MKKYIITAVVVVCMVLLAIMIKINNGDAEKASRTPNTATTDRQPEVQITANQESSNDSIYEKNMQTVKSYMDAVYNRSSGDDKDLASELKDIVSQELLETFANTKSGVSEGYTFETKLKRPVYTANQDTVIVLYTLKTVSDANENEQDRMLVATVQNGKISSISKDTALP